MDSFKRKETKFHAQVDSRIKPLQKARNNANKHWGNMFERYLPPQHQRIDASTKLSILETKLKAASEIAAKKKEEFMLRKHPDYSGVTKKQGLDVARILLKETLNQKKLWANSNPNANPSISHYYPNN